MSKCKFKTTIKKRSRISINCNEKGLVLIGALALISILALVAIISVTTAYTDIKISGNYKTGVQVNYIARAGAAHGRQALRLLNAASTDRGSFSDELENAAGANMTLEGYTGDDDVPIVDKTELGNGSYYTVYLTNDLIDGYTNLIDSNNRVSLTSIATTSNGSQAVVELTVSTFELFPLPGTITLLGSGATFTGGASDEKDFRGDDRCGGGSRNPVVALSDVNDVPVVQAAIIEPGKYWTKDENNVEKNFNQRPDLIVTDIPQSTIDDIESNYGIDLLDPNDLDNLVAVLQKQADTVAPDGSTDDTVNLGDTDDLQVVVVTGDFTMSGSSKGAGILVVTGTLTFDASPDYDGLILVIGKGSVIRNGGGSKRLSGGIMVANTTGGVLGSPSFVTIGEGSGIIRYCSTDVSNSLSLLALTPTAIRERF